MSIRYFATNRNRENLDQKLTRPERISLQRGGYNFVDMKAYMSYYLETTEANKMPVSVLVTNSKEKVFSKSFLANSKIGRVVVCVHGFNVDFHEAQTWFGILTDTLRHTGTLKGKVVTDPVEQDRALLGKKNIADGDLSAFIGFSWPSDGKVLSYMSDQREAIGSAIALANLITRLHSLPNKPSVNLISHSMGNYLACHMFKSLINHEYEPKDIDQAIRTRISRRQDKKDVPIEQRYFVDRYVMLAPDVERRHVTKCVVDVSKMGTEKEGLTYLGPFYSGLEHLVGEVHNFYSRFDGALAISNVEKAPRKAVSAVKGFLDTLTLGMIDFLERNPDERWEERLGATQDPINAPPNMKSHNAVELSGREIGHSDYIDSREIAEEIANILVS